MEAEDAAQAASALAGRALLLKFGWIGAVLFLVFLLFIGVIGGGSVAGMNAASGADCGPGLAPAPPTGPTGPGAGVNDQQIANAQLIDQVATQEGLPGQATFVALITALQESSLINLDHGDLDSVGLFQQRPSQGWGSKADIMNPTYAATSFFMGRGGNKGLTQIPNWADMDPAAAAQAVQHSANGSLYAGQETEAKLIAGKANINLNRVGSPTGNGGSTGAGSGSPAPASSDPTTVGGGCDTSGGNGPTLPAGSPFTDGPSTGWPAVVKNPRTTAQAIAWAQAEVEQPGMWQNKCLEFVANAYGWNGSGFTDPPADLHAYATELYKNMPASMRHDGSRNPPVGALLFWSTSNPAGHVALYIGNGLIASSDIKRVGYIDIVPATEIESKWGGKYLGWAPPYFPNGS